MEFGPIWRALLRNKTSYILIALQIAVTMAIMVNAIGIIQERSIMMARPTGVDEDNIFYLSSVVFNRDVDYEVQIAEDLVAIRNFPGVRNAVMSNTVPLQGGGWSMELQTEPGPDVDGPGVAVYFVDEEGIDTFGVELIAGRGFTADDVIWYDFETDLWPPVAVLTEAMARESFPDLSPEEVIGKTVYIDSDEDVTIIGIVKRMQAAWSGWSGVERTMLVPLKRGSSAVRYIIRAEPGYRDEIMPQIEDMLATSSRDRLIRSMMTMEDTRHRSYVEDEAMVKLLVFVVSLLTAITCLGIVGLASFNVARRTRQIGTRRALGATRGAIMRYFLIENFLVSSVGVVVGAILAVGLNIWMVDTFNLAPIDWYLVPSAMLVLWLVGQVAVIGPARRGSKVSPAIATRAV